MKIERVSQEFAKDLISLINGCKGIEYNAKVSYGKTEFEYVTLDKIYAHVKQDNNFAIFEPLGTNPEGKPALQIVIVHKSGEAITSDYYPLNISDNAKKQDEGAAITYTKRYALGSFLGLCTEQDIDGGESGKKENPKLPPRERLIMKLNQKGIDVNEYAKEKGLTNKTTPETFEKLIAELGD